MRRHKVTVVYESGATVTTRCKNFTVRVADGRGIIELGWDKPRPKPLAVGIDHVVAVWSKRSWWPL